jgi:hypothetical protein
VTLSAAETKAELVEARERAQAKIDQLMAEQREAAQARETARGALVEFERHGGRAAERRKLEEELAAAEVRATERWPERIEGARAGLRDAQAALQAYTAEHLDELVQDKERDGEVATSSLNAAAETVVAAYRERERIASELSLLVSTVARVQPGDISFSRGEALARAAAELLESGGEAPPVLRRDPREPRLGAPAEEEAA